MLLFFKANNTRTQKYTFLLAVLRKSV